MPGNIVQNKNISLADKEGLEIDSNNPIPIDAFSIYPGDIDILNSDIGEFSGKVTDFFNNYSSAQTALSVAEGGSNPKTIKIVFKRPVISSLLGVISNDVSISNAKLTILSLSGVTIKVIDYSQDDTKRPVHIFQFEQKTFGGLIFEFYTDDEVNLVGIGIAKSHNMSIDAINAIIAEDNSSETPIGAGLSFTGGPIDTKNYGIVVCSVYSDVSSATNGFVIEFSTDMENWYWNDTYTIDANTGKTFSVQTQAQFMRVRYINGPIAQSVFCLQTVLKPMYIKPSSHRIADKISGQDDAELIKSVLTGENPIGEFINFQSTAAGNFKMALEEFGDTPSIDPFDRLRVSEPYTIFDSKQLHDKQPLFWDELLGGSASSGHVPANASVLLSVTANINDFAIRQTKQYFNYQPGKGQLIFMTFLATNQTGVKKRIGLFNGTGPNYLTPKDGIFFENYGGTLSFNIAKNGVITETASQIDWNYDKLNGNGLSLVNINMNATQIIIIDYEWLGVGRVRVGFVIDGIIRYCHYFNHANVPSFSSIYMSTPNLPLRYSIESDGSGAGSLDHICSTVMSEGGLENTGILRSSENSPSFVTGYGSVKYALIGIRLKSSYLDISVIPESVQLIIGTNDAFKWELHVNPTVDGTFTYTDKTFSAVQEAKGVLANTVSADGLIIASGGGAQTSRGDQATLQTALRIGSSIAGVQDTLVLVVRPFSTNVSVWASMNYRELL